MKHKGASVCLPSAGMMMRAGQLVGGEKPWEAMRASVLPVGYIRVEGNLQRDEL